MPEFSTLILFMAAAVALLLTPGPAVLYIVARSVDQGRVAGLVSVLGIQLGTLFHIAAAALGVSALLVSSALAFNTVKYLGAAYLIYLGLRKLFVPEPAAQPGAIERRSLSQVFFQGMLVNLLNPKAALFFFAFLPQFVDVGRGGVVWQILFLGGVFVLLAIISDSVYALLAGAAGSWLKTHAGFLRAQRYVTGSIYLGLGLVTAVASPHRSH